MSASLVWGARLSVLGLLGLAACSSADAPANPGDWAGLGAGGQPSEEADAGEADAGGESVDPALDAVVFVEGTDGGVAPVPIDAGVSAPKPTGPTLGPSTTCGASYYSVSGLTAAHKTLAFGTRVRVTNTANGRSVDVRINDRGPFIAGRCLDLSTSAFAAIGSLSSGVLTVRFAVIK
jgi:rare lipoprotein A